MLVNDIFVKSINEIMAETFRATAFIWQKDIFDNSSSDYLGTGGGP